VASIVHLPLFPLSDVVLFPQLRVLLHIFEPRYRQMTGSVLAGDRRIGMVAALPARALAMRKPPATYSIGCAGIIEDYRRLPDGRYNIVLLGTDRFRIQSEQPPTANRLYRVADAELLEEANAPGERTEVARRRAEVVRLFCALANRVADVGDSARDAIRRLESVDDSAPDGFEEIENAVLIQAIASSSRFTPEDRQALLEKDGIRARFEQLAVVLRFALAELEAARTPPSGFLH